MRNIIKFCLLFYLCICFFIIKSFANNFVTYTTKDGLLSNNVTSIYVDNIGTIYAGTASNDQNQGGLSFMRRGETKFTTYSFNYGVYSVYVDDARNIYVGTAGSSQTDTFFIFKPQDKRPVKQFRFRGNGVSSIYGDTYGNIYTAIFRGGGFNDEGGLYSLKAGETTFTEYSPPPEGWHALGCYSVFIDDFRNVYTGCGGGISILKAGQIGFITYGRADGLETGGSSIYVDKLHNIYVGGSTYSPGWGGLFVLKTGDTKFTRLLSVDTVSSIYVDNEGTIYVGAGDHFFKSGGLFIQKKDEVKFTKYTTSDGLGSNLVHSVYADEQSNIYVGTSSGLSVLMNSSNTQVK